MLVPEMHKDGVIRAITSPFFSSSLLVRKKMAPGDFVLTIVHYMQPQFMIDFQFLPLESFLMNWMASIYFISWIYYQFIIKLGSVQRMFLRWHFTPMMYIINVSSFHSAWPMLHLHFKQLWMRFSNLTYAVMSWSSLMIFWYKVLVGVIT